MEIPSNAGHRERLRKRYLERGFSSLQEYEVLELLLTYVLPRKDTKALAKELLKKFGTIADVCKARKEDLEAVKGVKENTSILLNFIGDLEKEFFHNQDRKSTRLNSSHANISYAVFCLK